MAKKLKDRLEEIGDEFRVRILEAALKGNPDNFDVLFELGNAYTTSGRYEEGLAIDRRLIRLRPDNPIVHYNLACSLSLLGEIDESLEELEASFKLGYREYNYVISDSDLQNLRKDGRFAELIERYLGGQAGGSSA